MKGPRQVVQGALFNDSSIDDHVPRGQPTKQIFEMMMVTLIDR